MEMVWLRNHSQEPNVAVEEVMTAIRALQQQELSGHLALLELLEMAENPDHKPRAQAASILRAHDLIKGNGYMPLTVQNIVLSAIHEVKGELFFDSPIATDAPPSTLLTHATANNVVELFADRRR